MFQSLLMVNMETKLPGTRHEENQTLEEAPLQPEPERDQLELLRNNSMHWI